MTIAIEQMLMQITAFQFFFLSFFLFTYKKGHGTSNQLFALFLFSKGLLMSFNLLLEQRLLLINLLYFPTLFFYAPVLFLFINSKINKEFRFTPLMSLHLLPSLILFISNLLSQAAYLTLPQQYPTLVNLLYYVQAIIYTVLAITAIHNVKLVSTTKRLLKLLMAGFLLVMVIFATNFVMMILQLELPTLSNALVATGLCLLFLFANGIVYTTLRHPELFSDQSTASPAKILSLPKAVNEQTALKLKNLMEAEKLYLNPNLTLPEVADRMNLHQRTLSLVLKHLMQRNFLDFINAYRIQNAVTALESGGLQKPLLEIQMDAAFNSKSVFNAAFKKHMGMTPSAYKKQIAPQQSTKEST